MSTSTRKLVGAGMLVGAVVAGVVQVGWLAASTNELAAVVLAIPARFLYPGNFLGYVVLSASRSVSRSFGVQLAMGGIFNAMVFGLATLLFIVLSRRGPVGRTLIVAMFVGYVALVILEGRW